MKMSFRFAVVLVAAAGLTGCLKTRSEVREEEQRQVYAQQTVQAQAVAQTEKDEDLRDLRGRIEVLEHKVQGDNAGADAARKIVGEQTGDLNRRLLILQDAVTKQDAQIIGLNAELTAIKAALASQVAQAQAAQAQKTAAKVDSYELGQEAFSQKDWKNAILGFQKYREDHAKGKNVPDATYKIGVSFQELGMKDEAKTFYDEVVSKYPNAPEAKKAKTRLKSLKK